MKELFITALGMVLLEEQATDTGQHFTIFEFFPFEMDLAEIAEIFVEIEKDAPNVKSDALQKFAQLIRKILADLQGEPVKVTQRHLYAFLNNLNGLTTTEVKIEKPFLVQEKLRAIRSYLAEQTQGVSDKRIVQRFREVIFAYSRLKIQKESLKRDKMLIHAVNTVDDLNNMFNLVTERVIEWYGLHFPELENLVRDHYQYLTLIVDVGQRENFNEKTLEHLSEKRRDSIIMQARASIGGDIHPSDLLQLQSHARLGLEMKRYQRQLESYITDLMEKIAPNIKSLVGAVLGSKLIAKAGGLEQLAKMPASRIQVLGAEKAVFLHLRHGAKPPKHGLIYQDARIHGSPKYLRGKIARALANKLAIAARLDYFSSEDRGEELQRDLLDRIEQIKKQFPKPPKKKPSQKDERKRDQKKRYRRKPRRSGKEHRRFKDRKKMKRGRKKK